MSYATTGLRIESQLPQNSPISSATELLEHTRHKWRTAWPRLTTTALLPNPVFSVLGEHGVFSSLKVTLSWYLDYAFGSVRERPTVPFRSRTSSPAKLMTCCMKHCPSFPPCRLGMAFGLDVSVCHQLPAHSTPYSY